jgi:hypothetical protein
MPKLEEIDRWMSNILDINVNTSMKLNSLADLTLQLGRKVEQQTTNIDRLIEQGTKTEAKIDQLVEQGVKTEGKIDRLVEQGAKTEAKLDRLSEHAERNEQRFERLLTLLEKRAV